MITTSSLSLNFGKRFLFEDVSLKFTPGNCYGLIGANGAGKSTFVKILAGEIEPSFGSVNIQAGCRMAVLRQDHFAFDEFKALDTVIMGNKVLFDIMKERDTLYAKPEFTEKDGIRASELEERYGEMGGWEAEAEAAELLSGLGVKDEFHDKQMKELGGTDKVKVLLAQALFGNPDILLMDEPTNHLDASSILWLEDFLLNFKNTVIVVSHDRHFLDTVCTHVCDIDFGKIQMYTGNYSFWYESSQLALRQRRDANKRKEDKIKELKEFIARFSANASKSRQATSRKNLISKITLEDIRPSSRRYPNILFRPDRELGKELLTIEGLEKKIDGETVIPSFSVTIPKGERVAFCGSEHSVTTLFNILCKEDKPDAGTVTWGITTSQAYFPKDNTSFFDSDMNLVDWLRQYSRDKDEGFIRGFLGRMLFSGDDALKKARVLSGGERVRCMLSRMMLAGGNVLLMDEPTNHLDLESITALNDALIDFPGSLFFISHDFQFVQSLAQRIIEITPYGIIDKHMSYEEYVGSEEIKELREKLYPKKS